VKEQRRGRRIAMSASEIDAFLGQERTCRVATVGADGRPHNSPLWFVWDGRSLWLNSIVSSQRWADLERDGRVSVVVDAGDGYGDLRGVELLGSVDVVGEVPRSGTPDPAVEAPERLPQAGSTLTRDRHDARGKFLTCFGCGRSCPDAEVGSVQGGRAVGATRTTLFNQTFG